MSVGAVLLLSATAAAAVSFLATAWALVGGRRGGARPERSTRRPVVAPARAGRAASLATLVLAGAATAHLAVLLGIGDFSVRYVWQHAATHDPLLRRLGALLAGQEGSFLVWSTAAAAAAVWAAHRWARATPRQHADHAVVHLVAAGVAVGVLALTVASDPFRSVAVAFPDLPGTPPEGRGLNPVLANAWMPPHTLLTFAAYALIGLVFAITVLELLRAAQGRQADARRWRHDARRLLRWAWLTLSASLLTGLVWAYEEMSFGWFWSWDPVEAATLSVWLALTAALHARAATGGGRHQLVYAPLLGGLAFVGVVFASFVTRSGLHPSVHAFASGAIGRYLGVILTVAVLGLAGLAVAAARTVPSAPVRRPWLFWAAWLLLGGAGLITWGLTYPMAAGPLGRAAELDTGFFTLWGYLVAVVLLLLLGLGLHLARSPRRDALATAAAFAMLTVAAAFVTPTTELELIGAERRATVGAIEAFLGRASLLSLLPPAVYATLAIVERWWSTVRAARTRRRRVARTGSALAHLGAVVAIVGVIFATVLSSTVTVQVDPATGIGSHDGVTVRITDHDRTERTDALGAVVEQRETVTVEVHPTAGATATGPVALSTYPERDGGRHPQVLIHRTMLADTQVIYHGAAEQTALGVPVTVRRIPLVNLVWAGAALLLAGAALLLASARGSGRPADDGHDTRRAEVGVVTSGPGARR